MAKNYTVVSSEEIWRFFSKRIFSGGGSLADPKLVRSKGLRPVDFDIRPDPVTGQPIVHPHPELGLSFASTIDRLVKIGYEGVIWEFAEPAKLPPELLINFDPPDHPLINVVRPMPVSLVITLLNKTIAPQMKKTGVKIVGGKLLPL